jgi:hypothetical protein
VVVLEVFNIDISFINKFGFLKISPPLGKDDLEAKIKEISEKRDYYITEGEKRLLEDEDEEVEQEIEDSKNDRGYGKRDNRRR